MGFLWFNGGKKEESVEPVKLDLHALDRSFNLLQEAADSVSTVATDTANYLREELELTKYRFFSVIDAMVDIVIIKNNKGEWITSNAYANRLLNLQLSDYYQKTNEEIGMLSHLDMQDFKEDSKTDIETWELGQSNTVLQKLSCNGTERYFDLRKTPTYYDDACTQRKELIIIGRDVTDIRKLHEYGKILSNALDNASDDILIISAEGNIMYCNNAFLLHYGYSEFGSVINQPVSMIKSDHHSQKFWYDLWNHIKSNRPWEGTIVNKTSTGDLLSSNVHIIPVMNGEDEPIHYISIMKASN